MAFLNEVLEKPSYGFMRGDKFYAPSHREIWKEFFPE